MSVIEEYQKCKNVVDELWAHIDDAVQELVPEEKHVEPERWHVTDNHVIVTLRRKNDGSY